MKINVLPSYKEIFNEEPSSLSELLFDIPSRIVISLLSGISATLSIKDDLDSQIKIYQIFTGNFSEGQKKKIFGAIHPYIKLNNNELKLFSIWTCTEFIERELIDYREIVNDDLTSDHELQILKAYMVVNEDLINKRKSTKPETSTNHSFVTWPLLIKQFEFNIRVDPVYQAVRSLLLFNLLEKNLETKQYVDNWIGSFGRPSYWNYILDLINLCTIRYSSDKNKLDPNPVFSPFAIQSSKDFESIFEDLTNTANQSKSKQPLSNDYIRIRDKPLFKIDGKYIVLNWDFLFNKLYNGLLFSFYKNSGITHKFQKFPDFKSHIGTYFSERVLLRRILNACFNKRYVVLNFDDELEGLPDCYYRNRNHLFLFEFKDALISSEVIQNQSFEEFKNDIELKFVANANNKPKGISQLIQHIIKVENNNFTFDSLLAKKIKKRNLRIFPIIVYTHPIHSMPGINDYLDKKFKASLNSIQLKEIDSKKVKPLTLIDLEFFFRAILFFRENEISLEKLIDRYHSICANKQIEIQKKPSLDKYIDIVPSFIEVSLSKINYGVKRKDFIGKIFEHLGIVDGPSKS